MFFSGTKITSFEIPENVTKIDVDAFSGSNITNITINPSNHHFSIENSILYSKNKSLLYFTINKSLENIVIPDSVTTLGEKCFSESKLTSIIIPSNVKRIENNAFSSCKNLISVTFLGSLDYIGSGIFSDCNNLEFINFPYSSMIVNSYTFISSNNPKVNMSFTHKTLFSSDAIKRKTNVYVSYLNEQNLIITTNALIMNSNQTIIYEYLGYNIDSITIPNTVRTIKSSAFENSTSSISFEQNSQLSIIENNAFRNCSNLNKLDFSSINHLQTIQFSSFKDCSNLAEIIFSSPNLYINNNAFENCTKLAKMINILNIPDQCFSGCSKLKQVTIRENARTIGFRSFENCIALTNIIIPSTVETISEYSFVNCNKLKSITFSQENSLSMIFVNSFSGCDSLQNISNFKSTKYQCIDNTLYYQNETSLDLIYHLSQSLDKVLIINCTIIRQYSFNHSNNIFNISILPGSVSLIESYSFNNCLNLKFINFPLSVKTVEQNAFYECRSIRCPLFIENKTTEYLKMIVESGISPYLIIKCRVVHGSNKLQCLRSLCNKSAKLFFQHLSK